MRFTPDLPARTPRQKASFPIPFGLTAPIPVITTRGFMSVCTLPVTSNWRKTARALALGAYVLSQIIFSELSDTEPTGRYWCPRVPPRVRAWDNHTDAAGIVHFRSLLQDEMQLLQLRIRCLLPRRV